LAAVADDQHEDDQLLVFDPTHRAIITDPITPQTLQLVTQAASESPRVVVGGKALAEVTQNLTLCRAI
jgi:hypothetical protein